MMDDSMYCPVCGREIEAETGVDESGEVWRIFVHDEIDHTDSDMLALEAGIN